MTVTKLKQKSYDKLSRTNYLKKLDKKNLLNNEVGDSTSDIDIESDDSSSSSGNSQNLTKYFESKYNKRSLLSILNEGPQVPTDPIIIIDEPINIYTDASGLQEQQDQRCQSSEPPQSAGGDGDECSMEIMEEEETSDDFSGDSVPADQESDDVLFCGHHVGKVLLSGNCHKSSLLFL
jgi:hypothetical protein